jgi:hypothetical protein
VADSRNGDHGGLAGRAGRAAGTLPVAAFAKAWFLTLSAIIGYPAPMTPRRAIQVLVLSSLILMHAMGSEREANASPLCGVSAHNIQDAATTDGPHTTKQLQFKIILAGEMFGEDRTHLAITSYAASDGAGLTVIHGEFPSPVAAQEYLEKVLARALKVTERGEKKDKAGKVVGRRATAIVPTGNPDQPFPAIVLTYGTNFYEIESLSSRHSRIMEMRLTSSN